MNPNVRSLAAGVAGAGALNLVHESGRHLLHDAPHVDQIAMRAIGKLLRPLGFELDAKTLRRLALGGDLLSNSLYYAVAVGGLASRSRSPWLRGALFGLAAGIGAVALPPKLGLGQQNSRNFPKTAALTIAWYTIGGLAAAACAAALSKRST